MFGAKPRSTPAALQAAGAGGSAAFRPQQPAPQIAHLQSREMGAEGAVGGAEEVMPFVEDIAGGEALFVLSGTHRRLHHHQRMVGDDDLGLFRAPR